MNSVDAVFYKQCQTEAAPAILGNFRMTSFASGQIDSETVSIQTQSLTVGQTDAILIVKFQPISVLKAKGGIAVQVPAWYKIQDVAFGSPIMSTESMLGFESEAEFRSHSELGYEIISTVFQPSSRTIVVQYEGPQDFQDEVELMFTNFKTPVNRDTKYGFQISTQDALGYIIDQSIPGLPLGATMRYPVSLRGKELYLLGDAAGENVGRVGAYNRVQVEITSDVPLEQDCWFVFDFPELLKIDTALELVQGWGIFQPSDSENALTTNDFDIDMTTNSITVRGCQTADALSSAPSGTIEFNFLKLPSYITSTGGIQMHAYTDSTMTEEFLVIADPEGIPIDSSQLTPGYFEMISFIPSNYFAFSPMVSYTIEVKPQHNL